jgi:hypothetical protein
MCRRGASKGEVGDSRACESRRGVGEVEGWGQGGRVRGGGCPLRQNSTAASEGVGWKEESRVRVAGNEEEAALIVKAAMRQVRGRGRRACGCRVVAGGGSKGCVCRVCVQRGSWGLR